MISPNEVVSLFEEALERSGWIDDKVADQFPRSRGKNDSGMLSPGSGSAAANNGDTSQSKKRGPSKSLRAE